MKFFIITCILLAGILGGLYYYLSKDTISTVSTIEQKEVVQTSLSPEVEAILDKEEDTLRALTVVPVIIAEVKDANNRNSSLSIEDINKLDAEWRVGEDSLPLIQDALSNETAQALIEFQKMHPGFKEIFVADAQGLNVGQTDKTSDYYQADEAWWVDSFNGGVGLAMHGKIEFDDSSQTEAISIYLPIYDAGRAIGVLKGVLDLSVIKNQL